MGNQTSKKSGEVRKVNATELQTYIMIVQAKLTQNRNKKVEIIKKKRKEVVSSLEDNNLDIAKAKMESVLREEDYITVFDILGPLCEILKEKVSYMLLNDKCPDDMRATLDTVIYASTRLEIDELHKVREIVKIRYGELYISKANTNADSLVNVNVVDKLRIKPATDQYLVARIKQLCREENIVYEFPQDIVPIVTSFEPFNNFDNQYSGGNSGNSGNSGNFGNYPNPNQSFGNNNYNPNINTNINTNQNMNINQGIIQNPNNYNFNNYNPNQSLGSNFNTYNPNISNNSGNNFNNYNPNQSQGSSFSQGTFNQINPNDNNKSQFSTGNNFNRDTNSNMNMNVNPNPNPNISNSNFNNINSNQNNLNNLPSFPTQSVLMNNNRGVSPNIVTGRPLDNIDELGASYNDDSPKINKSTHITPKPDITHSVNLNSNQSNDFNVNRTTNLNTNINQNNNQSGFNVINHSQNNNNSYNPYQDDFINHQDGDGNFRKGNSLSNNKLYSNEENATPKPLDNNSNFSNNSNFVVNNSSSYVNNPNEDAMFFPKSGGVFPQRGNFQNSEMTFPQVNSSVNVNHNMQSGDNMDELFPRPSNSMSNDFPKPKDN